MNLWQKFEIKSTIYSNKGISFHYEHGIEDELKKTYLSFVRWLRRNYVFPVHLNVYVLNREKVLLRSGKEVYGRFRWFPKRTPVIHIPSAIEEHLRSEYTDNEIYEQILSSLVHELSHYYQWCLKLEQSDAVSERQANYFRFRIVEKFALDTCQK